MYRHLYMHVSADYCVHMYIRMHVLFCWHQGEILLKEWKRQFAQHEVIPEQRSKSKHYKRQVHQAHVRRRCGGMNMAQQIMNHGVYTPNYLLGIINDVCSRRIGFFIDFAWEGCQGASERAVLKPNRLRMGRSNRHMSADYCIFMYMRMHVVMYLNIYVYM